MEYYCTICCKEKQKNQELIPAISRYNSKRISFVYDKSIINQKPMIIFSGKYGFLSPQDLIPWYDFKLNNQNVSSIVPLLATQIKQKEITSIVFYCQPKSNSDWYPYHIALECACKDCGVTLSKNIINIIKS